MKNNSPKVSIIIPVHNEEKTLKKCLDLIIKQNYDNFEIIVVDNNSTDKTKEIIETYLKHNSKIKYIFEAKKSRGVARNTGEKNSTGEIILMTDSDCIVPENWINTMIEPIVKKECDSVQGGEQSATDDYWSRQEQTRIEEKRNKINSDWPLGVVDTKNFAILKSTLERVGFTNTEYKSVIDTALSVELKKHDVTLLYKPEIRVIHSHPNTLWKVINKKIHRGYYFKKLINKNEEFLKETDFIKSGKISPFIFIEKIQELKDELLNKGFSYMFFDLVTGLAWRIGTIIHH